MEIVETEILHHFITILHQNKKWNEMYGVSPK